jgi:hypothetical protein
LAQERLQVGVLAGNRAQELGGVRAVLEGACREALGERRALQPCLLRDL